MSVPQETKHHTLWAGELRFITAGPEELTLQKKNKKRFQLWAQTKELEFL